MNLAGSTCMHACFVPIDITMVTSFLPSLKLEEGLGAISQYTYITVCA